MLVVVSPGQGSQQPAMFNHWIDDPQNKVQFEKYSALSNLDLIYYGTQATKDEIKNTQITQPLLSALSLVSFFNLNIENKDSIIFAGHSVGEFSASVFSDFMSEEQAIKLVSLRGKFMNEAASETGQTGMAAILGGDRDQIINELKNYDLFPANINSQGQIIASGKMLNIDKLLSQPIDKTKVIKLDVSGAFHTPYMQKAKERFISVIENENFKNSNFNLLSNYDGELVSNENDLKNKLSNQITNSVRWDLCQETMLKLGATGLLEVAPGGILSGIAKKAMPQIEILTIKTPDDIENANAFIMKHNK